MKNAQVDELARLVSTQPPRENQSMVEVLPAQTIEWCDITLVKEELSWMDEILYYESDGALLANPMIVRRVKHHQA